MRAAEPLSPTEYTYTVAALMDRIDLITHNQAGTLLMYTSFDRERDRLRAELADITTAHAAGAR